MGTTTDTTLGPNRTPSRAMVIIHGAGDWPIGYSKPMVETIQGFIDSPVTNQFERIEVNYSDVIKSSAAQAARATLGQSQAMFMNALMNEHLQASMNALGTDQLLKRMVGQTPQFIGLATAALFPGSDIVLNALAQIICGKSLAQLRNEVLSAIAPTIQDVCLYLSATAFENQFRQKLIDKLHEAQKFDEVILVSHSLGTVITFDVLNAWKEETPKIPVWFTMGCPLAKVLRLASGRSAELKKPSLVKRWFNIYNTNDLVANMLSPTFNKDGVYDVFCALKDPAKSDPGSAHDYFTNSNALRLVADVIATF
ncbi:MAG: hypothetical protein HZB51_17505 [Chloroflexi bacterium]|nr:hypothetical protein [Chloroflexota bacterium]